MNRMPAQFFRLKKEWKSVLCWLLAPILLTVFVMKTFGILQEESKVPIALIVEDSSMLATQLAEEIEGMTCWPSIIWSWTMPFIS